MSEHDDNLSRRYRELAREEPPAALDASILAASRRAVQKPALSRRWAMPVSIAAVLVLAFGVTLQMQREEPGIETSVPAKSLAVPPQTPAVSPAPLPETPAAAEPMAPKRRLKEASPRAERDRFAPLEKREAFTDQVAARPEPRPFSATEAPIPTPAAPPPPLLKSKPPVATLGIRGLSAEDSQAAAAPAPQTPATATAPLSAAASPAARMRADTANTLDRAVSDEERELERIAKLRADGRHEEADKAIAEFRRIHPAYRIPDAMWERIRPR
jgi:hypothetical protein